MPIKQMILRVKNSLVSLVSPISLKQGELAVNIPDKKIWIGDSVGSPVLISCDSEYSLIRDIRPSGVHGGTSRKKTWNVRSLNAIIYNSNNNVSLVGDDFKLKIGVYSIQISAPASDVEKHKLRIYNETTSITEFEGITIKSEHGGSIAMASGVIISNGTDLYEIQHYTDEKQEKTGLGEAMNIGNTEIYTVVDIVKIGV